MRNTGQRKWNNAYRLVFINGDMGMAGASTYLVPEAEPGEEVLLSIEMRMPPARNDAYVSSWRLHDDRNVPFSETVDLAESLRKRDVYFEQVIFPDEVHGFLLHRNWLAAFEATARFFDKFLKD